MNVKQFDFDAHEELVPVERGRWVYCADYMRAFDRLEWATELLQGVADTGLLRRAQIDADLSARVSKFLASAGDL